MAVESYYFSHDYNARTDKRMNKLLQKEGVAGFGIYWCVVEMLYEEGGKLMLDDCESIAFALRTKEEIVKRVVINFELFRNDGTYFWSESVLRRMEARQEKSNKARESALERWKKRNIDANALRSDSEGNAIKERKGKEIKVKEKETTETVLPHGGLFGKTWSEWEKHRIQKRQKLTDISKKKQLEKLSKVSEVEAVAMIEQSITNGWTGIFEIKQNGNEFRRSTKEASNGIKPFAGTGYGKPL